MIKPPTVQAQYVGLNGRFAALITKAVSTMWAFYLAAVFPPGWIALAEAGCGDQGLSPADCLLVSRRARAPLRLPQLPDVASGDKRDRADTTRAFGIGFTAVYQVADTVVLISNGRRWAIDEMQPETSRIIEHPAPETTVILPLARDPNSLSCRRTASAAIGPDDPQRLLEVLLVTASRVRAAENDHLCPAGLRSAPKASSRLRSSRASGG